MKHRTTKKPMALWKKIVAGVLALSLVVVIAVGVEKTLSYLTTATPPIQEEFSPAQVTCQVTGQFDTDLMANVNVLNTSNIPAFIRVKLVSYRVNGDGERIGGFSAVPAFTLGQGWVQDEDGYYYYTKVVQPDETPDRSLIGLSGIPLIQYTDADGGRQVIEVLAEAVQGMPMDAVRAAWGLEIRDGKVVKVVEAGGEEP